MALPRVVVSCREMFPEWQHCEECGKGRTLLTVIAPAPRYHLDFQNLCCRCVPAIAHLPREDWDRLERLYGIPRANAFLAALRSNGGRTREVVTRRPKEKLCEVCNQEPATSSGLCKTCESA